MNWEGWQDWLQEGECFDQSYQMLQTYPCILFIFIYILNVTGSRRFDLILVHCEHDIFMKNHPIWMVRRETIVSPYKK